MSRLPRGRRRDVAPRPSGFVPFAVAVPKDRCPVTGKIRYEDPLDAKMVVANVRAIDSTRRSHLEQRTYECDFCSGIHTTSQAQRTR